MANYVDQDTDEEELHGKTVKWATITVYEFGVDIGPSSVPTKGGPPIGLAGRPEFTWSTRVGEMAECSEGVHRFTREERVALLRAAGVSDNMITRHARETNIVLQSRRRSLTETLVESESDEDDDDDVDDVDVMDAFLRPRVCKRPALDSGAPFVRRSRMIPTNYVW
ncbi:TPA: hypothetical protein N0F65_010479 [Lagenidium giganteum]|uniref:Uncharacterized protein n=1 Tax=Lagenidium giganteum TaxID=4803 RepID=A0AAV2ZBB4_9STRA|nr:TPA: hypothetical protein N0F65_010479 [Lagenidium giganteum]